MKGERVEALHLKTNTRGLSSHAIVEFFEEATAASFAKQMKGHWEGVNLLRIETSGSAIKESFDHRTVVVGNLPVTASIEEVENRFSNYGNILRIEMPSKDI